MFKLIATLPFRGQAREDISDNPLVDALRINTTTELSENDPNAAESFVRNVFCNVVGNKTVIFDLKTRDLRVDSFTWVPYASVTLTHKISVDTPTEILLKDGTTILETIIDGNKLVLDGPDHRPLGRGEAIRILDPTLKIEGFLTPRDRAYIKALNLFTGYNFQVWLSFVQSKSDFDEIMHLMPDLQMGSIGAKIEDEHGLKFVRDEYPFMNPKPRLIAACDDLYINIGRYKLKMLEALRFIIKADPDAVAASRILTSIYNPREYNKPRHDPSLGDLAYLEMLKDMGYTTFMLCDDVCRHPEVFARVMDVYEEYLEFSEGKKCSE